MSSAHQAMPREWKPDQLLFDEELEKRHAPIEQRLQHHDIDPRLVIGNDQVPAVAAQGLESATGPGCATQGRKDPGVDTDPVLPDPHQPARQYAAYRRHRQHQFEYRKQEQRHKPDNRIDGQYGEYQHTSDIAQQGSHIWQQRVAAAL